jgi:hypothetical protein
MRAMARNCSESVTPISVMNPLLSRSFLHSFISSCVIEPCEKAHDSIRDDGTQIDEEASIVLNHTAILTLIKLRGNGKLHTHCGGAQKAGGKGEDE